MSAIKAKMMKDKPKEPEVKYVPYEQFNMRVLIALNDKLDKLAKDMDIIKERITFDYKKDEAK